MSKKEEKDAVVNQDGNEKYEVWETDCKFTAQQRTLIFLVEKMPVFYEVDFP